jgi:hypothetical protein
MKLNCGIKLNFFSTNVLCGEERNVNNWPRFWTSEQINDFRQKHDWSSAKRKMELGCILCQNVGTLEVEKKMGMKMSKV